MTVAHVWAGAVTETSATIVARCTGEVVRLGYAIGTWVNPAYSAAVSPTAGVARFDLAGLAVDTGYVYKVEEDGILADGGTFATFPSAGEPASFRFAASSCAGLSPVYPGATSDVSNSPVYGDIVDTSPLFFVQLGDLHYRDISTDDPSLYRDAYDDTLAETEPNALWRSTPVVYAWDDHDFGANDSGGDSPSKDSAQQVYRERVPHYPLGSTSGAIWQTFTVGRVRFVVTDSRSDSANRGTADSAAKKMLGDEQEAWFYATLLAAPEPLVVWVNSTPWADAAPLYDSDSFGSFTYERQRIMEWLIDNDQTKRLLMICGDIHANALAVKETNPWGWFPIVHVGSLDATPVPKGGPFTFLERARGQFGVFAVTDTGTEVSVTVEFYRFAALRGSFTLRYPRLPPARVRRSNRMIHTVEAVEL